MVSEKNSERGSLSVTIHLRFASVQKPVLHDNPDQTLLPLQAQQLGRSYNGRLMVNVEIAVRDTCGLPEGAPPVQHEAFVGDLCPSAAPGPVRPTAPCRGGAHPRGLHPVPSADHGRSAARNGVLYSEWPERSAHPRSHTPPPQPPISVSIGVYRPVQECLEYSVNLNILIHTNGNTATHPH
jgi:hypothetical protein